MAIEDDLEYQAILLKAKKWRRLGVVTPLAANSDYDPIFDPTLPLGSKVWIPAFSQGWDCCIVAKDQNGLYAESQYGNSYRLAFGPNWYVTSELPPQ